MECTQCGYCECVYDCVFFPIELYKLQFFRNSKIIKDGDYYYLNKCEHFLGGKCTMHDDRRPFLCMIYPVKVECGRVFTVDLCCPAHATVTEEDIAWARGIVPLKGNDLDDLIRASRMHNRTAEVRVSA